MLILLTKLAVRRNANLGSPDEGEIKLTTYAEDLAPFPLVIIASALEKIGKRRRAEGESAFPEIGVLIEACDQERRLFFRNQRESEEKRDAEETIKRQEEHERRLVVDPIYAAEYKTALDELNQRIEALAKKTRIPA